jgi:hypothetical protein
MTIETTPNKTKKFRGGIQEGTMAWDANSLALDKQISRIAKELSNDPAVINAGYSFQKKLRKDQIPGELGACAPDGGVWFKNGKPIAAFEAKKQGDRGNAIERWYKNAFILNYLNPTINYVTFTCGEGATANTPIGRTLAITVYENGEHHFNKYREGKPSVFLSVEGYTDDEVRTIMKKALCV